MEIISLISIIVAFFVTALIMPFWIKKAKHIGLVWKDMNKIDKEKIAGSGGLVVILGFILGVLVYIAIQTFIVQDVSNFTEVFAITTSLLLLAGIGIIDDLLGWQHGGLRIGARLILVAIAAIPLMVINAGFSEIFIPFIGSTNISILYPLIFIPIGIIGATTTFNFLAGFNGLESSQGIIVISSLAVISVITGALWLGIIGGCMVASLFAFLIYNKYPAKIFPGDVLTYPVGGLIAIMAILGNYELLAVFIFIPYVIETGLKLRGKLKKSSFGKPEKDGSLINQYDKFYGLEHIAISIISKLKKSKKAYEWEVVMLINFFQIVIIALAFLIFVF